MEKPAKRRNLERRRESSRYAARDRRTRETELFNELKLVVPLVAEPTVTHVDRIAMLRVATALCRIRQAAPKLVSGDTSSGASTRCAPLGSARDPARLARRQPPSWQLSEETLTHCMDGFLLVCDEKMVILYISEGISSYLGLTQTDLIGRDLDEFINQQDVKDMRDAFALCAADGVEPMRAIRFKSVVSPRGRSLNLKSAAFKAVMCRIKSVNISDISQSPGGSDVLYGGGGETSGDAKQRGVKRRRGGSGSAGGKKKSSVFVVYGTPTSSVGSAAKDAAGARHQPANGGAPHVFSTRHTCDMKFSYCSDSATQILGYDSKFLMGSSLYDLVYPTDLFQFSASLKPLFSKGYTHTIYYRMMTQSGGLLWVQTEFSLITHTTRGQRGHYAVGLHTVLGGDGVDDASNALPSKLKPPTITVRAPTDGLGGVTGRRTTVAGENPLTAELTGAVDDDGEDGGRRHSYDEVLQWLFRDHPESPAPIPRSPPMARRSAAAATVDNADDGGGDQQQPFLQRRRHTDDGQAAAAAAAALRNVSHLAATKPDGGGAWAGLDAVSDSEVGAGASLRPAAYALKGKAAAAAAAKKSDGVNAFAEYARQQQSSAHRQIYFVDSRFQPSAVTSRPIIANAAPAGRAGGAGPIRKFSVDSRWAAYHEQQPLQPWTGGGLLASSRPQQQPHTATAAAAVPAANGHNSNRTPVYQPQCDSVPPPAAADTAAADGAAAARTAVFPNDTLRTLLSSTAPYHNGNSNNGAVRIPSIHQPAGSATDWWRLPAAGQRQPGRRCHTALSHHLSTAGVDSDGDEDDDESGYSTAASRTTGGGGAGSADNSIKSALTQTEVPYSELTHYAPFVPDEQLILTGRQTPGCSPSLLPLDFDDFIPDDYRDILNLTSDLNDQPDFLKNDLHPLEPALIDDQFNAGHHLVDTMESYPLGLQDTADLMGGAGGNGVAPMSGRNGTPVTPGGDPQRRQTSRHTWPPKQITSPMGTYDQRPDGLHNGDTGGHFCDGIPRRLDFTMPKLTLEGEPPLNGDKMANMMSSNYDPIGWSGGSAQPQVMWGQYSSGQQQQPLTFKATRTGRGRPY